MNDSYSGNLELCGFPMKKSCGNDEEQPPPPSSITQEDDFKFANGFHWKIVLFGYGCGFIFGLGLGYLVFSSGKPKWLVNIVYGKRHYKLRRSKKNAHWRTHWRIIWWMQILILGMFIYINKFENNLFIFYLFFWFLKIVFILLRRFFIFNFLYAS